MDNVPAHGADSTRTVRPLGLFYWGDSWSLGAWCQLRKGFRNFRVDRIASLKLLKTQFTTERDKTLDDYLGAVEAE